MKKTGERLKRAREDKGLSLHEVGLSLKISSKILKAIEEDDQAHLPAKTFVRGFVQSYAQYLRVNNEEIMALFTAEMGSTRPEPILRNVEHEQPEDAIIVAKERVEAPKPVPKNIVSKEVQIKPIIYSIIGIGLVITIFFVKRIVDKYQKEAIVETVQIENPLPPVKPNVMAEQNSSSAQGEPVSDVTVENKVKSGLIKSPLDVVKTTDVKTNPALPIDARPVETLPMVAEVPAPTPAPAPAKGEPAATIDVAPSENEKPKVKTIELIVEAMDAVEIDFASDAGRSGKIKLNADQIHTFKSSNGLKINFDNGGAVNLIMNGKDLGVPGVLGKPLRLSF